jgi:DNA-binding MarR family transcriptional regulator
MKELDKTFFRMTHKELELLVVDFKRDRDVVTDAYERYLIYEALRRDIDNLEPYNLKWIESTLKLSFPKVKSIVDNLIEGGFLILKKSLKDKRINCLVPSKKLYQGTLLFEQMKINEIVKLGFFVGDDNNKPNLSDFNLDSIDGIRKEFLGE